MADQTAQRDQVPPAGFDLIDKPVGRFRIRRRLGAGGMGEVYLAEDTGLKRQVALKRIASRLRANAKSRQRLWKEAECASRLNDPHVASIYDVIEDGNDLFVVMEYIEGETLRKRLARTLTIGEFVSIAAQSASGLAAAHHAGLLHRDIKPENIMLTPSGQVKILDFGLARELPIADEATQDTIGTTSLSGTLLYMAPEVLDERETDARADIFSLGVVFYEALAGQHPFQRASLLETCNAILREELPQLTARNSEIPGELQKIVGRMLAKNRDARYATADDICLDLQSINVGMASAAPIRSLQKAHKAQTRKFSRPMLFAALGCILLTATGVAALTYRHFRAPLLNEHDSILLSNFENQTGQAIFDATVTEAVRQSLEQSAYVHLVPRSQLADAERRMGRPAISPVDLSLGKEICKRENYRALLVGRVTAAGSRYKVSAQVVDPWREASVLVEEATFQSPADLYPAVDDLTRRLRGSLGESLKQIQQHNQPLARVTTNSLEALQRYSRAMEFFAAGNFEAFSPLARSAVEIDPGFAMAHLYLSRAYGLLGDEKNDQIEMTRARQGLDRVTERERFMILGDAFASQGIYEKAAEQYHLLTDLYPDDVDGYRSLSESLTWAGHTQDALAAAQHAVQLEPQTPLNHWILIQSLNRLNKFPEALAAYESAETRGVRSAIFHRGTGLAYLGEGNVAAATAEFEQLRKEGGDYEANLSSLYLARTRIYEGRLNQAADLLRAGLLMDDKLHSESYKSTRLYLLVKVLQAQGNRPAAVDEARRLNVAVLKDGYPDGMRRAGKLAVELKDLSTARMMLGQIEKLSSFPESAYTQSCYYNLKGVIERAAEHPEAAIDNQHRSAIFYPSYQPYLELAASYVTGHDWPNAVQAYQKYLSFHGQILDEETPSNWVLANLWTARALAAEGDVPQSLQRYDEFLRLWAKADPELPALRQAQAERARLQGHNSLRE
jgi:tetratricopeptide (TPR) repeat protein/tRNA A-37 threonylcarbamoyl transferase component Bud32